ncbi:MAG TPA: hypothetical protein VGC86_01290 [Afipia sp.]
MKSVALTIAGSRTGLSRFALASALALTAILAVPHVSHAQGVFRGIDEGARRGNRDAGPVGAVVGGAVGGAVGGVNGVLGVSPRGYHHRHYRRNHRKY